MRSGNSRHVNSGAVPHRGKRNKCSSESGSDSSFSKSTKGVSDVKRARRRTLSAQKHNAPDKKSHHKSKSVLSSVGPPAAKSAPSGPHPCNTPPLAGLCEASLSVTCPVNNCGTGGRVQSGDVDGDGAAAVLLSANDSDGVKDGMRQPPLRRPFSPNSGPTPHAPAHVRDTTPGQSSPARKPPHSLAPPPRRKHPRPPAAPATSSSSSSSSHAPPSAGSSSRTASSTYSDSKAKSRLSNSQLLRSNDRRQSSSCKAKSKGKPAADRASSSGGAGRTHTKAVSRSVHTTTTRHSKVSRSSHAHGASQRVSQYSTTARRPLTPTESDAVSSENSSDNDNHSTTTSTIDTGSTQSSSSSSLTQRSLSESDGGNGKDSREKGTHSGEGVRASGSSSADDFLSSSSSAAAAAAGGVTGAAATTTTAAAACALTDTLPRELYLHICSFLSEVDCCTLLEVSLRMHGAITCADSYVWRRLCMNTWQYKQGFQTFIQRVRALENLARREEREVQALQQHMLLLREQDTFFGESDVSATCDDATVLIRRRQHEQAQWMAAAAMSSVYGGKAHHSTNLGGSGGGGGGGGAFGPTAAMLGIGSVARARRGIAVGSSTTSASSETRSYSDDDDDEGNSEADDFRSGHHHSSSSRRRGRSGGEHRRLSSKRSARRSSTAAASSSHRSGRQSPGSRQRRKTSHVSASRSASEPSHRRSASSAAASATSTKAASADDEATRHTQRSGETGGSLNDIDDNPLQLPAHSHNSHSIDSAAQSSPRSESSNNNNQDAATIEADASHEQEDEVRRKDRRVRIRLPEEFDVNSDDNNSNDDEDGSAQHRQRARTRATLSTSPRSPGSSSPLSSPASPSTRKRRSRDHRHHHHHHQDQQQSGQPQQHDGFDHHRHRSQGDTPKRQTNAPPPISKHRRSHSVKKRKPAKQRRRKRGRSRRPRATGGGGGRHRSQHHRSQSRHRHHRGGARQQHHHHQKASKSTRRRRRRQRNAAAAAAQATAAASSSNNNEGGMTAQSVNANGVHHGNTFFYQTPTYEAIKSTTPVLSVQHVAPALVPFQLGGRPAAGLQSAATNTATTSPVGSGILRYPSRDSDVNLGHATRGPAGAQSQSNANTAENGDGSSGGGNNAFGQLPGLSAIPEHCSTRSGIGASDAGAAVHVSPAAPAQNNNGERSEGVMTTLSRPFPQPATAAAAAAAAPPSAPRPLAPLAHTTSLNSTEDEGLYWWQLTPEARQQQLRRLQQREQRQQQQQQQQQQGTVSGNAVKEGGRRSHAAPDGDEVADEAALREWDALEASFGSSAAAAGSGGEDNDDDGSERDEEEDDGEPGSNNDDDGDEPDDAESESQTGSSISLSETRTSSQAMKCNGDDDDPTSGGSEKATHNRLAPGRLRSRPHLHSSSYGGSSRRRRGKQQKSRSYASSATSSRTHTSPPSSSADSRSIDGSGSTVSKSDSTEPELEQETDREDDDDDDSSKGSKSGCESSRRAHLKASHSALSSSSSVRRSTRAERQLARALAKRYEAIEEAMIITRSKSVLIHTLERQTFAHLPRLLAAAAAQRQRRLMMAAHIDPTRVGSASAALPDTAAPGGLTGPSAAPTATAGSSGIAAPPHETPSGSVSTGRPVLLLGSERSPVASPPAAAAVSTTTTAVSASASSTLPSSLSNAFPTSPGVALTVPASPLHQLARISSSTALADGVVMQGHAGFHTPPTAPNPQPSTAESNTGTADGRIGHPPDVNPDTSGIVTDSNNNNNSSSSNNNVHDDDDDDVVAEEEEEPLAPVSWKFAYFMSRREARRATITLQDLLEGMWLVCFRSTGRTHPIRFTRQMQVLVYPPLKTAEEEEAEEEEDAGEGVQAAQPAEEAARRSGAETASHAPRPAALPVVHARPGLPGRAAQRFGGPPSTAAAAAMTAPPLPFHILQGGAQLVVHQFPPMKVVRRSTFSRQGGCAAAAAAAAPPPTGSGVTGLMRAHVAAPIGFSATSATTTTASVGAAATTPGSGPTPRTLAAEAEQRFLAEPHATLRRLQLRMMSAAAAAAATTTPADSTMQETSAQQSRGNSGLHHHHHSVDGERESVRLRQSPHDAAEVTQSSVRRTIAQHLGFAPAYVTDVLGTASATVSPYATAMYSTVRGPLSQEREAAGGPLSASEDNVVRSKRKGIHNKRRRPVFGPPTLEDFEAQQRLEACFAPGGVADVQNDWGWTITGHHVKIFSLDVTAPLYVERLQRIVDVEVIGRSHGETRSARRPS